MTACWNVINTEWDPDQETVNFGTRQFVQDGSALYDVVTLATVECSNPVSLIKLKRNIFGTEKYFINLKNNVSSVSIQGN